MKAERWERRGVEPIKIKGYEKAIRRPDTW